MSSTAVNFHRVTGVKVEERRAEETRWVELVFTDSENQTLSVTLFTTDTQAILDALAVRASVPEAA